MRCIFKILYLLFYCSPAMCQSGTWTWMYGDSLPGNSYDDLHSFYDKGQFSDSMIVPKLYGACSWSSGKDLYLLGGQYLNEFTQYPFNVNAMWKFNIDSNKWAWIGGAGHFEQNANVYGLQGIADSNNFPGERVNSACWTDLDGNFWLFGGEGWGGQENDLWKYDVSTGWWTWMKGPNMAQESWHYGVKGVPDSANEPRYRDNSECWTDPFGNLWLFGGYLQTFADLYLNDLWKYNIATNEWTWMTGDTISYPPGVYGTLGIFDSVNTPGGRMCSRMHWTDTLGNLYLFGGFGVSPNFGFYQDFWKYNISLNQWAWMGGEQTTMDPGSYNSYCLNNSYPSSRAEATGWIDKQGNCWMFSGHTVFSNPAYVGGTNDLWKYDPYHNEWYWIEGDNYSLFPGEYGTQGVPDLNNEIRNRFGAVSWIDSSNNFWVWGGAYTILSFNDDELNDLWRYTPDSTCGVYTGGSGPFAFQDDGFIIAPNPATSAVTIVYSMEQNGLLTIINAFGAAVRQVQLDAHSGSNYLDVSDLAAGIYFVRLQSGNQMVVKKMVKE